MKNCYTFSILGKYKSIAEFLLTKIITQFPTQFINNEVNIMYLFLMAIYPAYRIQFIYYAGRIIIEVIECTNLNLYFIITIIFYEIFFFF